MVAEISNMLDILPTLSDRLGNLKPTLTDHVNIGPDSPKMHSYWPVSFSGNTALTNKVGSVTDRPVAMWM